MTAAKKLKTVSEEEYLKRELLSQVKNEYVAGRVYAMSGGSANHSSVASNFIRNVGGRSGDRKCRTYTGDLSVRIRQVFGVTYLYPDASVVCSPVDGNAQFTTEPVVIQKRIQEAGLPVMFDVRSLELEPYGRVTAAGARGPNGEWLEFLSNMASPARGEQQ